MKGRDHLAAIRRWNAIKVVVSKYGCENMNWMHVRFEVLTAVLLKVKSSGMLCYVDSN